MSFEMKRLLWLLEGKRLTPKILPFFFVCVCEQKGCAFIFLHMISLRGHFKDARITLREDRSRVFSSSKIFSQCSLSLPENIAGSRSIKWATDAKPEGKKKRNKLYFLLVCGVRVTQAQKRTLWSNFSRSWVPVFPWSTGCKNLKNPGFYFLNILVLKMILWWRKGEECTW